MLLRTLEESSPDLIRDRTRSSWDRAEFRFDRMSTAPEMARGVSIEPSPVQEYLLVQQRMQCRARHQIDRRTNTMANSSKRSSKPSLIRIPAFWPGPEREDRP